MAAQVSEMRAMHEVATREATLAHDRDLTALKAMRLELHRNREEHTLKVAGFQQEVSALRKALEEDEKKKGWLLGLGLGKIRKMDEQMVDSLRMDFRDLANKVQVQSERSAKLSLGPQTLEEIAASFVDIAAFIEEMEVTEGLERKGSDPRGVDKMRKLAMKLHALAAANKKAT